MPLEAERKFLQSHRNELLQKYGDKYLIISEDQVTGAYDTIEQALEQAAAQHGLKSVLIRRPSEAQIEFSAPALVLEILSCQSSTSR